MTVQAIHPHSAPRRLIETFRELDAWLEGSIINAQTTLDDGETAQASGRYGQQRAMARVEAFTRVRTIIAPAVAAEIAESVTVAHEESVEQAFKGLDPVNDALEIRRLAGDR